MNFDCKECGNTFSKVLNIKQISQNYQPKFCSNACQKADRIRTSLQVHPKKVKVLTLSKNQKTFENVVSIFIRDITVGGNYDEYNFHFHIPSLDLYIDYIDDGVKKKVSKKYEKSLGMGGLTIPIQHSNFITFLAQHRKSLSRMVLMKYFLFLIGREIGKYKVK